MQDLHLRYRDHPEGADASLVHCSSVRTPPLTSAGAAVLQPKLCRALSHTFRAGAGQRHRLHAHHSSLIHEPLFSRRFVPPPLRRPFHSLHLPCPRAVPREDVLLRRRSAARVPPSEAAWRAVAALSRARALTLAAGRVLTALDFLQRQRKLAHGNVKGSNVLVSSSGEVKLSDLQLCMNLREEFRQSSLSIVSSRGSPSDKRFRCCNHFCSSIPTLCLLLFLLSYFSASQISAATQGTRARLSRAQTAEPRHMERGHPGC